MHTTLFKRNLVFLLFLFSAHQCLSQHSSSLSKKTPVQKEPDFHWIFHPTADPASFGVYHFRKQLDLAIVPLHFKVKVSGDNRYQLFVNGKRMALGPAKGDVAHWRYETVDLAPALKKGKNIIAALIWNEGEYLSWSQISYRAGFMIQGSSRAESAINADTSWKVMEDKAYQRPPAKAILTPFENVKADQYPWGWQDAGYDDHSWVNARVTENPSDTSVHRKMVSNVLPLPEEIKQRFSKIRRSSKEGTNSDFIKGTGVLKVAPNDSVSFIIDQGSLTTAFPELLISGGKGATVTITYSEAMYDSLNGKKGNRNEIEGKVIKGNADVYMPDGGTNRLYRPLYYRTFRYVGLKIKTAAEALSINDFKNVFTAYPFKENASFKCSDPALEEIWNVGWRTARLCAYETYMDCPYYEQLQYLGDTRIQALISYYVSGDDRLIRNAIEQFSNSMTPEGLTHARYPESRHQTIPPFSLFWISMVNDYWKYKPDTAFVHHYLDGAKKILDWHTRYIDSNAMLTGMPYWNFVDWPWEWPWTGNENTSGVPPGTLKGHSSILTLQYVYGLRKGAELFRAFKMDKEADHYSNIADRLQQATYRLCWDSSRQMLSDTPLKDKFSQHANVMAILTDAFPPGTGKELIKRVVQDTTIPQCTYYYRFYLNQAMKKAGLGDQYVAMLKPWKEMIHLGLSTFAERPEPTRSDCHGWSASPNYDFLATIAGIEPASPGFKTISIVPNLGSLQWIEGKMPVPAGEIRFKLKRAGNGGIKGEVTLPSGSSGSFLWNNTTILLKGGSQTINI